MLHSLFFFQLLRYHTFSLHTPVNQIALQVHLQCLHESLHQEQPYPYHSSSQVLSTPRNQKQLREQIYPLILLNSVWSLLQLQHAWGVYLQYCACRYKKALLLLKFLLSLLLHRYLSDFLPILMAIQEDRQLYTLPQTPPFFVQRVLPFAFLRPYILHIPRFLVNLCHL